MTFKQNTKMSAEGHHYKKGGRVKKMNEGGSTTWDDIQKYVDDAPKRKAEAEQRMKDYHENNAKNSAQFKENMSNISKDYDSNIAALKAKYPPSRSGGAGTGEGASGGDGLLKNEISAKNPVYKRGGSVKKRGAVSKRKK
jgi:hypothetical protein